MFENSDRDIVTPLSFFITFVPVITTAMTSREFEASFRRLYLPLGMYALRLVDDADVAEDLEQDAFMKAWIYIEEGGVIDSFDAFIYRTLRNV